MTKPMNLLFIMSDQHNPQVIGASGHPVVKTPNLDKLAEEGTRFSNAYCTSPICVPSRASLATGRYAHQIKTWDNAAPYIGETPSWGHRLTEQGFPVTTIGKLHYRRDEDDTGFPDQRLSLHILDGVGDIYSLLRGEVPTHKNLSFRDRVMDAGIGESEYTRYDRAITKEAVQFLKNEAKGNDKPWVLFVSFITPHYPLIAPEEYSKLYQLDEINMPHDYIKSELHDHPAIQEYRRITGLSEEVDEMSIRRARAAYYGLCSFVDAQIGQVLDALKQSGLEDNTRIIYTSDHGDNMGEHGLWFKSSMYEGSVGVPMIVSGPDIPKGKVVRSNVSLVDCFPTIIDSVGAKLADEDEDIPGVSLLEMAKSEVDVARTVFSEYHAVASDTGFFMIKGERYKYVHYVGYPPQLFDLLEDPHELNDLAAQPDYQDVVADCEQQLRSIVNPEEVDQEAKQDQLRRINEYGGKDEILSKGFKIHYTPAPQSFR